jgi:hypothetical protein
LHLRRTNADTFADGILVGPVVLREFVINDEGELRACVVSIGEETAT